MKPIDANQVVEFLLKYGPKSLKKWHDFRLKEYVQHRINHSTLAVIYQQDGAIVGVGCARPVNRRKWEHLQDPWRVTEIGNTLYMEQVATIAPEVVPRLLRLMEKRFGKRRWVMANRYGKNKYWDYEKYMKKAQLFFRISRSGNINLSSTYS